MNYHALLESHWRRGADVTVCVIPKSEDLASSFGLLKLGSDGRIEQFREKPKGDALKEMQTDTQALGLTPEEAARRLEACPQEAGPDAADAFLLQVRRAFLR